MATVAIVLTSHDEIGANGESTGVWLEELATPYYALVDDGHEVRLYSPRGGSVGISPQSLIPPAGQAASVQRWRNDRAAAAALANTQRIDNLDAADCDALVIPGGHGALWDLVDCAALTRLIETLLDTGRVVAAICHGPAALLNARRETGEPWVLERDIAAFTNDEETAAGLADDIPLALESELAKLGARFRKAAQFEPCAVRDGPLITGQNPASAARFAELLLAALAER